MSGSDVNYDDNEANWETPLMRSHVPANDYGVNGNSNSSDNWGGNMGPSTSKGARAVCQRDTPRCARGVVNHVDAT